MPGQFYRRKNYMELVLTFRSERIIEVYKTRGLPNWDLYMANVQPPQTF